jgi:ABC-type oligopeptide transport system substrate-binding subunit
MKKIIGLLLACLVLLAACGPKPYYKTSKGKKKQKYYNDVQYGGKSPATMKKGY